MDMQTQEIKNKNSWLPDRPDSRDKLYGKEAKVGSFTRVSKLVDLRPHLSTVENQLDMNSCTANAIATKIEMDNGHVDVSRLFLYWHARVLDNLETQDIGAYFRSALKAAQKTKTCVENVWKYDKSNLFKKPSKSAYSEAFHGINSYSRISGSGKHMKKQIQHALDNMNIVVFGTTIYPSFEKVRGDVYLGPVSKHEKINGYHAVAVVGYDRKEDMYCIRNSWGKWWGQEGYTWFPGDYLVNLDYNMDFWVVS